MGQNNSSSQALFAEIDLDGISDDVVEQINQLWKKYDNGQGSMDKKVGHKFLGALYVFLMTRGDMNKHVCNVRKKEIVVAWFIYFDKNGDGLLSKEEFLYALHSMLTNYKDTTLDIVATFCPEKMEEVRIKLDKAETLKQEKLAKNASKSRSKSNASESFVSGSAAKLNSPPSADHLSSSNSNASSERSGSVTSLTDPGLITFSDSPTVTFTHSASATLTSERSGELAVKSTGELLVKTSSTKSSGSEIISCPSTGTLCADSLPEGIRNWMNKEVIVTEAALDNAVVETIPFLLIPNIKDWKANKKYRLVLSLDGGGIRGTTSINFLACLEEALGHPLYEIFDMMAATSTGALQIGLIGGIGKTAQEAKVMAAAEEAHKQIFPHPPSSQLTGPKYDGKGKTKLINQYMGNTLMSETKIPLLITTYNITKMEAWLWVTRSCGKAKLSEIIDASSAAPTYFPPVKIYNDFENDFYIDGGINANDPSMCALVDAMSMWPGEEIRLLSIGTGLHDSSDVKGDKAKDFGVVQWMTKGSLLNMMMDVTLAQKQAKAMLGNKFLRVNSYLKAAGCNTSMDDRDPSNVESLALLGKKWWNYYGHETIKLITDDDLGTASNDSNPFSQSLTKIKILGQVGTKAH